MLIPYRPAIKLTRVPWVTIAVGLLCLVIYVRQDSNVDDIHDAARRYCTGDVGRVIVQPPPTIFDDPIPCADVLTALHTATDPASYLKRYVNRQRVNGRTALADAVEKNYPLFAKQAPYYTTSGLWQRHSRYSPVEAVSAALSHGSWTHVIGNLFFFVAFAVVVETVLGPLLFGATFVLMAWLTGTLYFVLGSIEPTGATLGLSGVVMGMMTLAAYFVPRVKIRFLFIFMIFVNFVSFPLWGVAAWYVGWDLMDYLLFREFSSVAFAGHLAGAASGLLIGLLLFRKKRHWIDEYLLADEPAITQDTSLAWKLREMSNASFQLGVGMFAVFFIYIAVASLFILFLDRFAAQLLIGAPIVVGVLMLRRMEKGKPTPHEQYQQAMRFLDAREFDRAEAMLLPLAEARHARAQLALAHLYATASGGHRSEAKVVQWLERAAAHSLPEARYLLGSRLLHGEGVRRDYDRAVSLLETAANGGIPEAAQALGYLYTSGPPERRDREKAIEWYYKAGRRCVDLGRIDEARAILTELDHRASGYPAVLGMVKELERLVRVGRTPSARPKASG